MRERGGLVTHTHMEKKGQNNNDDDGFFCLWGECVDASEHMWDGWRMRKK